MSERALAVVVALLLLVGAAACGGGDDDDGANGAFPSPGDAGRSDGGGNPAGDACALLEVAEIEAEFGDRGAVADGEILGISCSWEVGSIDDDGSGIVAVTKTSGGGSLDEIRELTGDPVTIDGLGDEAFFDGGILWFRSGDDVMSVTAAFFPEADGTQEKLTTLARHMLERV